MSLAVLRISSQLPKAFRIIPVGRFHAHDGREGGHWYLMPERGRQIAALANQNSQGLLIDFEHESLKKADAPEAGRATVLEWRDDGLYVADASWTAEAKAQIASGKKRFISPVFRFNGATGEVLALESIALTGDPALLGLTDLSQVAVASAQRQSGEDASGSGMTARDREVFEHVFGTSPEALAAPHAEKPDTPPEGVTAEDWANLRHVFGDALNNR
ncbi:phage protease [Pseudomonas aeruginosa]